MFHSLTIVTVLINVALSKIIFVYPRGQSGTYTGYLWEGSKKVYLRPRLQAIPNGTLDESNELCGIKISTLNGHDAPFYARVVDRKNGFVDLLVKNTENVNQVVDSSAVFYLEAYDCAVPPHLSEKVPIRIHVIAGDGPFFIDPSYSFTINHRNFVGDFVGQVQAIQQPEDERHDMNSAICNYQLDPQDTPFTIDKNGVIRTRQPLGTRANEKPYMFRAIAEDCHRPTPRSAFVDVIVRQFAEGCQAGWKGLPTYLEYRGSVTKPEKVLRPYKMSLEVCVNKCEAPEIRARLELKSAVVGYTLQTASPEACLLDPDHILNQQLLCGLHPTTLTNFLPNPDQNVASQLISPALGNPPQLSAPTMVWRFNASTRTVWQVDPKYLTAEPSANAFDTDFTISFWLRRNAGSRKFGNPGFEEEEEIVVCSRDRDEPNWHFMSIGFSHCNLIVRLMSSLHNTPSSLDAEPRKSSVWTFGPLPDEYCSPFHANNAMWHHYAITFSHNPWGATSEMVSLLLDGKDLGALGTPTETRLPTFPPFIPKVHKATPQITIGACFDPITRLTTGHINADLTGLTVLTERAEAINNLRCVAQCGESLIIPDILKHLRSDVTVDLGNNAITVVAQNVSHVVDVLQAVAYVRPQAGMSPGYTPHAVQTRLLSLTTTYSCSSEMEIPHSEIKMHVFPESPSTEHAVQVAKPIGSVWTDVFERPPLAQADMEKRAWIASKRTGTGDSPPALLIDGSDIVITEPPIKEPGIQIFSDIRFLLPDDDQTSDARIAAAAVPLDGCLVWIVSSQNSSIPMKQQSPSSILDEGRIEWSLGEVRKYGLFGMNDKHGVHFRGQRPAGDYEKILKTLHYWPPLSVLKLKPEVDHGSSFAEVDDFKHMTKIGLICTSESGGKTTSQLFVNVVIESPENAMKDVASNDAMQNLSPDDEFIPPHYAYASHQSSIIKEARPRLRTREIDTEQGDSSSNIHPSRNNRNLAIGLSVCAVALVAAISLIIGLHVQRRTRSKPIKQQPGRRRRFPAQPADFGGSSLKYDPTLRLTANPMGEVEYNGIGVVSEDLYGSSRNIAPNQHIFSPPLSLQDQHETQNLWANARLAGLDEFDEEYLEEPSEEFFDESSDLSHSNNNTEGASLHHSQTHGVDVHDWIDEEDPLKTGEQSSDNFDSKCKLVAVCPSDEFGPPVVNL